MVAPGARPEGFSLHSDSSNCGQQCSSCTFPQSAESTTISAHEAEGLEHSEPALPPGEGWRKLPRVVFNLEPLKSRFCQAWWCLHLIPNLGAEVGRSQNLRSIWNTKIVLDQPELHNETLSWGGKKVDSMN